MSLRHAVFVYGPLLLIGFIANVIRIASRRASPERHRLWMLAWIMLVLVGVPLWLFLAATVTS